MRILISFASGTDKGEGLHLHEVMERKGHCPIHVSKPSIECDIERGQYPAVGFGLGTTIESLSEVPGCQFDLFLYVEPLGLIPKGLNNAPFPTACIISDVHQNLAPRVMLARFFDHVFLYQRDYLDHFQDHDRSHLHWLPYACDLSKFYPVGYERDIDVAFIGQLISEERRRTIRIIADKWSMNEQRYYFQHEIPKIYSRAKIAINLPLNEDLNFRVFEAMSCGAMLLTKRIRNGQEVIFREGVHYVGFSDERDMLEKIEYYLSHEDERESIAAAGLAEVQAHHRLEQRIDQLFEKVTAAPDFTAPIRQMTPTEVDRQYAWLYEYWRAPEAGLRLVREARLARRPWLPLMFPAARSILRILFR